MNSFFAVLGLGGGELVLVLVVILVLFGAKRIPEFAKGLGKGISEFKKASREVTEAMDDTSTTPTPKPPITPATPQNPSPAPQHPGPETKVV